MKKTITLLFVSLFVLTACEGPQGPPGFDGENGLDGLDGIQGQVFQLSGVNFEYLATDNLYTSNPITFGNYTDFEILESDAILIYRYEGTVSFENEEEKDLWSLIPQNFFLEQGTIQYVYNHTQYDVELFIDGNFDLSTLSSDFTNEQVFRFVIIPSEFLQSFSNKNDLNAVMKEANIKTIQRYY